MPKRWFDGLRVRIAAVLLVALLLQFAGGEILFNQIENAQMERGRARFLTDHLTIAAKLIEEDSDPETMDAMSRLWRSRLTVKPLPDRPEFPASTETAELEFIREQLATTYSGESLLLSRKGNALEGALQLEDGSWLGFRSDGYFLRPPMYVHYVTSVLLLIACAVLSALLFGRMIGRPLRQLVEAAEKVGRDEPVTIEVDGPREVRQVAGAFEAMQARLLAHVRDQTQSFAAMSHDLRTPLARLRLNSSMVQDPELQSALEEDVKEMEAFVTSVLDYLRGDEAEAEQRADIASILMTIVDEAHDLGETAEYSGPDRFELVTRPLKLKRIVRNVVQNATRHAGNARISLSPGVEEVIITVDDDGQGIAEADMSAVFDPFTRLEASRNRKTGGAGLGLAISKRLATRLGGVIEAHNRVEGGLRVVIRLPIGGAPIENGSQR